ncbi:androgen receptor, partial [Pleuronectes platessa]|uniref:androgen receptor n=1 Tax=Pleuronectes platessa TaxID=8262 RepID=UPI00232A599A
MSQVLRLLSAVALPLCRPGGTRARLFAVSAARLFSAAYRSSAAPNCYRIPAHFPFSRRFQTAQRRLYSSEPKDGGGGGGAGGGRSGGGNRGGGGGGKDW